MEPRAQPRDLGRNDGLHPGLGHGRRVPRDVAAHADDLAVNARVRPEFEVAKHHDDAFGHVAVDVAVAEHGNDRGSDRTRHPGVAEDRDDGIDHVALGGGIAEHRDHRIGLFVFLQHGVGKHVDDRLARAGFGPRGPLGGALLQRFGPLLGLRGAGFLGLGRRGGRIRRGFFDRPVDSAQGAFGRRRGCGLHRRRDGGRRGGRGDHRGRLRRGRGRFLLGKGDEGQGEEKCDGDADEQGADGRFHDGKSGRVHGSGRVRV